MPKDNVIDFTKAIQTISSTEPDSEEHPIFEMLADEDILDVFISALMMIRMLSITETVSINVADEQIIIESRNFIENTNHNEAIDSVTSLTKIASMFYTDEEGNMLEMPELITNFRHMIKAITLSTNTKQDENEDDHEDTN